MSNEQGFRVLRLRFVLSAVTLSIAAAALGACTLPVQSCDCVDGNIFVRVPLGMAAPTNTVSLSGSACAGASPLCVQTSGPSCIEFSIAPVAAGPCQIEIFLTDHQFSAVVNVKQQTGCCSGLFPDPLGAGTVDVTGGHFKLTAE